MKISHLISQSPSCLPPAAWGLSKMQASQVMAVGSQVPMAWLLHLSRTWLLTHQLNFLVAFSCQLSHYKQFLNILEGYFVSLLPFGKEIHQGKKTKSEQKSVSGSSQKSLSI